MASRLAKRTRTGQGRSGRGGHGVAEGEAGKEQRDAAVYSRRYADDSPLGVRLIVAAIRAAQPAP